MNYRHGYHAGNFADVVKHATLAAIIDLMQRKETPLRFVDTHAGVGVYDLRCEAAERTGEWRSGIGRLVGIELPPRVAEAMAPYLRVVHEVGGKRHLSRYPGSPELVRRLLRAEDRMVVNELHAEDAAELARRYARDPRVKVLSLDGWTALKAVLPPKERRGVTLIDPPFEEPGEFDRLATALLEAHRRFATGTVLLWYPIKDLAAVAAFERHLTGAGLEKILLVEIRVKPREKVPVLLGAGLIVHNPPFGLVPRLEAMLPFLAPRLALDGPGSWRVEWLAGERVRRAR
jgi:23S rRNA (adenine2030-N6)-methyltransferase